MNAPPSRPLPDRCDAGAMYWNAAGRGELRLPECESCRTIFWPPGTLCPRCGSTRVGWRQASGRGSIHTFTIVRQSGDPSFRDRVPYVVAMVDLDEGPRLMTNIVGAGALDATIGARVRVQFEPHGAIGIPVFEIDRPPNAAR